MSIKIHGKDYKTVAERVNDFRGKYGDTFGIITDLISNDEYIVMRASIYNPDGFEIATGFAEERRGSSQINKTSALENCETSAIGRALANLGFGGTEYASANEVENAIHQQNQPAPKKRSSVIVATDSLLKLIDETGADAAKICNHYGCDSVDAMSNEDKFDLHSILSTKAKKGKRNATA